MDALKRASAAMTNWQRVQDCLKPIEYIYRCILHNLQNLPNFAVVLLAVEVGRDETVLKRSGLRTDVGMRNQKAVWRCLFNLCFLSWFHGLGFGFERITYPHRVSS